MAPPSPPPPRPLTWLITGSSSGLGLSLTRHILSQGHNVIATSRHPSRTPTLVSEITTSPRGHWLALDVTCPSSTITSTINHAWSLFPRGIDVVVNNAAYSVLGAIEDIPEEQVRANFDTNFYGVLRVCKAILPLMRQRGSGTIVNVSSLLGLYSYPSCGIYAATKWALEGESSFYGARNGATADGGKACRRRWRVRLSPLVYVC
jgi:NAD(P)-dependent dehydrogenase (short-subunit alcohol dehydrogenase family)